MATDADLAMLAAARACKAHGLEWLADTDCTRAGMEDVAGKLPQFAAKHGRNNFASFAVVDAAGTRPVLRARKSVSPPGWQQVWLPVLASCMYPVPCEAAGLECQADSGVHFLLYLSIPLHSSVLLVHVLDTARCC